MFSTKKDFLLQAYNTTIVDSYWQDLLTEAAKIQNLPEPTFDRISGTVLVDVNGEWFLEETVSFFQKAAAKRGLLPKQETQPVERSRRIRSRATTFALKEGRAATYAMERSLQCWIQNSIALLGS